MRSLPTIIVAVAVAAMVALGLWQLLDRLPAKEAYLAQLAANPARPAVAFPRAPDDRLLFRRTYADCRPPVAVARAGAGKAGFRLIATCADGIRVQLGTTRDPLGMVAWEGGRVTGWVSHAPDATPLIARLVAAPAPQAMLLVADRPVAGLAPNTRPDIGLVPNNHLAYAVQWFLFAGIAAIIYVLAARRRR
ncbi:SURF1 family cytochrome oxidase biogenesis protein [Sphingomonas corticis]